MLILSRRVGETLNIGPDIQITVVAASSREVRLAIVAPPLLLPAAEEVHERADSQREKDHINWR